ncbi:MAG: SIS domain-containing protein [Desulfobacterales bacterium]|nr:SIS domain-containing protein [Desulfobacterales bacterium]
MEFDFFNTYFLELSEVSKNINANEFNAFIRELTLAYERQSHIFIFGNGGSGSTASHFCCDINKGVSLGKQQRFKMICLNDNMPTLLAYANDISYDDVFIEPLKNFLSKDDLVIGISGSGNSKNILKAIDYANQHEARTFGLCGYGGGKLKDIAQKSLVIHSNDMQKVEDLHMIILHCTMQWLTKVIA